VIVTAALKRLLHKSPPCGNYSSTKLLSSFCRLVDTDEDVFVSTLDVLKQRCQPSSLKDEVELFLTFERENAFLLVRFCDVPIFSLAKLSRVALLILVINREILPSSRQ